MAAVLRLRGGRPLDASALTALAHVGCSAGPTVEEVIRAEVRPHWAALDDTAKELILLHALNTSAALWPAVGIDAGVRAALGPRLAELCEAHLLEGLTNEAFIAAAARAAEAPGPPG